MGGVECLSWLVLVAGWLGGGEGRGGEGGPVPCRHRPRTIWAAWPSSPVLWHIGLSLLLAPQSLPPLGPLRTRFRRDAVFAAGAHVVATDYAGGLLRVAESEGSSSSDGIGGSSTSTSPYFASSYSVELPRGLAGRCVDVASGEGVAVSSLAVASTSNSSGIADTIFCVSTGAGASSSVQGSPPTAAASMSAAGTSGATGRGQQARGGLVALALVLVAAGVVA